MTSRFIVSIHARDRQALRSVQVADIAAALATATSATFQSDRDTWRIDGGLDLDGDELTVIVAFEDGVVVVTVF
jgi:hypothetical protein